MTINRMDVVIQGAGPYGFRLAGGDGRPLTVTKLRRQSKAYDVGLHEGDFLLGINGFECQTMSHSSAMALLENAVDGITLSVFRGSLSELGSAFDAASSTLRPLSPGSMPPPLLLPPPPAATLSSSGDLVIDQPSFLRQNWPQQNLATTFADQHDSGVGHSVDEAPKLPPPPPPPLPHTSPHRPFPPVAEPRVLDACPPQPLPPPDSALPVFRVKPFSGEAKHWAPSHERAPVPVLPPQPATATSPGGEQSLHAPRPTKWQPTETPILVRSHAEVNLDPEPLPVEITSTTWPTPQPGHVNLRLEHVEGRQPHDVEVIPRWALPLRSEYDWREAYQWADSDEWEITDDGQYCIRKKKIFADSSFYDEPEHKYPTIEEQIRMARKVAQSLTSPGNVKARGQRMFLRRREKADHWTADSLRPRHTVRRVTAARAALEQPESDAELPYYNPAPWSTSAGRAPWIPATNPSWVPTTADISPPPPPGVKLPPLRHVEPSRSTPKHGGNVPPQVAFGLAKDLMRSHDKGGRMFAKRRARAAVEETETPSNSRAVQAARDDVMRRITDSHVPAPAAPRRDVVDTGVEQPASANRLVKMIEKSRTTSFGPAAAHPTSGGHGASSTISFTTTSKTQAGFRPVRFKAPIVVTAADIALLEREEAQGISDF